MKSFDQDNFAVINRIPSTDGEFYQLGEEGNPPDAYELQITRNMKRLIYRDFVISNKYPNNIVLTRNKGVCVVRDMWYDEPSDSFQVKIAPFNKQGDFYRGSPCNSSDFDIYRVAGGINFGKSIVVDSSEIKNQFVCLLHEKGRSDEADNTAVAADNAVLRDVYRKRTAWVCIPLMHAQFR